MSRKSHFDSGLERSQIEFMSNSSVAMDRWLSVIAAGQFLEEWALEIVWRLKSDQDENTRTAALHSLRNFPQDLLQNHHDISLGVLGDFVPGVWKYRPLPEYSTNNKNLYFAAVIDILNTEGPSTGNRIERLLNMGSKVANNGSISKGRTKTILDSLISSNAITRADTYLDSSNIDHWILHIPGSPEFIIRGRNSRFLSEIPVNEARSIYLSNISIDPDNPDSDAAISILIDHYEIQNNELHKIGAAMAVQWEKLFSHS